MKFRAYLFAALGLAADPSAALAEDGGITAPPTSEVAPWVSNSSIGEGAGIVAAGAEWHPGASLEFGYDSNYLRRASSPVEEATLGPVVPSLRLRVTPQLSVRTLDRSNEDGKGSSSALPPVVVFDATGSVSYNEFIALDSDYKQDFSQLRNLQGGGGLVLDFFSKRAWSGQVNGSYYYLADPSNQGGFGQQFDRHTVGGGGKLVWAPGGGSFRWSLLEYQTSATFFDEAGFGIYDNGNHSLTTAGSWRFLPKTAVLYDGKLAIVRYQTQASNDGELLQGRLGLNGLLTKKLSLLVMGGWAASFFRNETGVSPNFDGPVGKLEANWFFTPDGQLADGSGNVGPSAIAVGFVRDYNQSYLGNYYLRHRGYGDFSYLIGQKVITTIGAGVARVEYPDFIFDATPQSGFGETRIDVQGFAEYRVVKTVGLNLQIRYDQNISRVIDGSAFQDDLSFQQFRAILGARWFM